MLAAMEKRGATYNNNIRRIFHMITISALALAYGLAPFTAQQLLPAAGGVTLGFLSLDVLRIHIEPLNEWVQNRLKFILRKHEYYAISGTSWFLISVLLSLALFPKWVSVLGFLYLGLGDPVASYVGIRWGKREPGQKTWVGCFGFFAICWIAGSLWTLPYLSMKNCLLYSMICAVFAALAETLSSEIDDNLVIPLVASTMLQLLVI